MCVASVCGSARDGRAFARRRGLTVFFQLLRECRSNSTTVERNSTLTPGVTFNIRAMSPPPQVSSTTTLVSEASKAPDNGFSVCMVLISMVALVAVSAGFFYMMDQHDQRFWNRYTSKTCFFGNRVCF
jgi:hypothetical protein